MPFSWRLFSGSSCWWAKCPSASASWRTAGAPETRRRPRSEIQKVRFSCRQKKGGEIPKDGAHFALYAMKPRFLLVVGRYSARREERAPLTTTAARTLRLPHHLECDCLARLQCGLNAANVFAAVDLLAIQLHDDVTLRESDVVRE